jgi:peptidoglycan L-alanyl-D-glutamate endopeptidase CwlK
MGFLLSMRSKNNLKGVHPDLVRVIKRALAEGSIDFVVIEGLRSVKRQTELLAKGASRTKNSRHLTGHAVDLAVIFEGAISWRTSLYYALAEQIAHAATVENVPVEWGGDIWMPNFFDGPHFQLPRSKYP